MAQWNHAERTLHAKVVYYGPAFGGKTTTLEALHRITDPAGANELISIRTADDRTLFFDLLPFELGDILGYHVAVKLYTVPGQVRYDTTRQVVLSGADALVFVADSSPTRREQNVWSLQNLRMNMRAKGLDAQHLPIVFQLNKRDLPDAAPTEQVAAWLGISTDRTFGSVATECRGVLEPLMAACRAMMEKIVAAADGPTRKQIDFVELGRQIEQAFVPCVERLKSGELRQAREPRQSIVLAAEDLLENSVRTSVELGERLSARSTQARRLETSISGRQEQLRKALDELRSLDEMKSRFLAGLSHELQSPLTAILGAAHVMGTYRGNAGERKELFESIAGSAETLQTQLDSLFRLAELTRRARPIEVTDVSPAGIVEEAIALSGHSGIQFKVEGLPKAVPVDPLLVSRALANLIDNAVKFSPAGSLVRVTVRAQRSPDSAPLMRLSVLDRGPGVREADLERIFRPFEQGGDERSGKPRGAGVGLTEARALAVQHGGSLEYHPRDGGGSEFRLIVPLEPRKQGAAAEKCHV